MNKMKYLLLVLIIFFSFGSIQAQVFSLGGGLGNNFFIFDKRKDNGLTIYFIESFQFNKIIGLDCRQGFTISTEYFGPNFGVHFKLFPINESVYLLLGINLHHNNEDRRTGSGTRGGTYTLPTVGMGVKASVLSFEILYQKPYPDGLGYTYLGGNQYRYDHNFNAIISFNLGLSWELKSHWGNRD